MLPQFRTMLVLGLASALPAGTFASTITPGTDQYSFNLNGNDISITRQGASCPSSCVQPMRAADGVETLAELEVISFLQDTVSGGTGLLVDVRRPELFLTGALPGAVNVPAPTFDAANPYQGDLLSALGAGETSSGRDFSGAYSLVLYGEGPASDEAALAVQSLLDAGYPAEKLFYYRGGAASWSALGLNMSVGQ